MTRAPQATTIIGGGSFGTVLANIAASNGHDTRLWLRDPDLANEIKRKGYNPRYLPDLRLDKRLTITTDMQHALTGDRLVLLAVPSKFFSAIFTLMRPWISEHHLLVSTTKGIAPNAFTLMSQIMRRQLSETPCSQDRLGVLSGPNLALELANKHISGSVIASSNSQLRARVYATLNNKYLHIFENEDTYGVELAGVLKNVYAIAAGISDALGFGVNTKSLLITRAIAEMARFAVRLKANHLTFLGLAGMGDLIVTCNSPLSRNYRLGQALARGKPMQTIIAEINGIIEGVHTTKMVYAKAQQIKVQMPILESIYEIIGLGKRVKNTLWRTLRSTPREDVEHFAQLKQQSDNSNLEIRRRFLL